MKLYTEEQLRRIYDLAFINLDQDGCHIIDEDKYFKQKIQELTSIEIPNNETIVNASYEVEKVKSIHMAGFLIGAYWMKEQILNKNK